MLALTSILFAVAPITARAGPIVMDEASLGASSEPHQVNLAPDGRLLVSLDAPGEIWRIDPITGAYTAFRGQSYLDMSSPMDAHGDGAGNIWFADGVNGTLGRIAVDTNSLTLWDLPDAITPRGVAIDTLGQVWVTDESYWNLYRFKPGAGASGQLSCYTLPEYGISPYVLADGSNLWLGDVTGRILRVSLDGNGGPGTVKAWQIAGAEPEGMALDTGGELWWADMGLNRLARLNPLTDQVAGYAPPVAGSNPLVVRPGADGIWYTEGPTAGQTGVGTLGRLDPAQAAWTAIPASVGTTSLAENPACPGPASGRAGALVVTSAGLSTAPSIWTGTAEGDGWSVYRAPAGGKPYGLAIVGDNPWMVDQGRRVLARPSGTPVTGTYLPLVVR
jgi:prepilin-type processing-associated H-X9-DG protein